MARRQVLSNETPNSHGFIVLNKGLDFQTRYKYNNVLMLQHDTWGEPIGKVVDIRLERGKWTGEFVFADTEIAQRKKKLYDEGFYNGASIGGYATIVEKDGKRIATSFEVTEISLVAIPSNPDAVAYEVPDKKTLAACTPDAVTFDIKGEKIATTLSVEDDQFITQLISTMEENKNPEPEVTDETLSATLEEGVTAPAEVSKEERLDAEKIEKNIFKKMHNALSAIFTLDDSDDDDDDDDEGDEEEEKPETLSVEKTPEPVPAPLEEPAREPETTNSTLTVEREEPVRVLSLDINDIPKTERMKRYESLSACFASEEGRPILRELSELMVAENKTAPERRNQMQIAKDFCALCATDPQFMGFMGGVHIDVDGRQSESVKQTLERLAIGTNSIDFIQSTPDLARVVWAAIIYRKLFPENYWTRNIRRVSGVDRAGVIWVDSAINPAIYFGNVAPKNAPAYYPEDTPVGLVEKVFALQPMRWQLSTSDLLAYDPTSVHEAEGILTLVNAIHNYTLQQMAEGANQYQGMTGAQFDTAGAFPATTTAAGNAKGMAYADLLKLNTMLINQNFRVSQGSVNVVMDAIFNEQLQSDPQIAAILSNQLSRIDPAYTEFSSFRLYPRSVVSLYDTAANKVVDPELYMTQRVNDNGEIQAAAPPVIPATAYGMALAFIPQEVIMAMGNTHVHMVSVPDSYGFEVSMDWRFGARVGRSDGKGVVGLYPSPTA